MTMYDSDFNTVKDVFANRICVVPKYTLYLW